MYYVWLHFDDLPIGVFFEPISTLSGYTPMYKKISETEGIAYSHLGQHIYQAKHEYAYVRVICCGKGE